MILSKAITTPYPACDYGAIGIKHSLGRQTFETPEVQWNLAAA